MFTHFKRISPRDFGMILLNDFVIPIHVKYANRLIIHTISLFKSLTVLQSGLIVSALPIGLSSGFAIYEYLNDYIDAGIFATKMCVSATNISCALGLSIGLSQAIEVKAGISITIALKTGVVKATIAASVTANAFTVKAGVVTIAIGASSIKAFGIGAVIMLVGALIILVEKCVIKALKNDSGESNKPRLYDRVPDSLCDRYKESMYSSYYYYDTNCEKDCKSYTYSSASNGGSYYDNMYGQSVYSIC